MDQGKNSESSVFYMSSFSLLTISLTLLVVITMG